MTIRNWIPFTGVFTYPIGAWLFWFILQNLPNEIFIPQVVKIIVVYGLPILFPTIITITNIERKGRGQTDFSFAAVYGLGDKDAKHSKAYIEAAYPDVPREYSSKIPKDFVLGKHKGKYVICPIKKDGVSGVIIGTPGSGKSVLLLGVLYSMLYRKEIAKQGKAEMGKGWNFFLVDVKGELMEKMLGIEAKEYSAKEHVDIQVIAPSVRSSYGYDVFYRIHKENISQTDYIKSINDIAEALVPKSGDDSPYFYINARKILKGVLMYYAQLGWEFIPIIKELMRTNLDELLTCIVADAEEKGMGYVIDTLKGFVGKSGNESVADIESTLKMSLEVFAFPEIVWCLHENPNKTSPRVLDDGKTCIDLMVLESMLGTYETVFRLICTQVLKHCESEFHERDDRYTALIFDEAARIGNISCIDQALATLRSKHTAILFFFQSISQFKSIYDENLCQTILNLCELKLFLSGSGDKQTTEYVAGMAGEWEATKMSYQRRGAFGGKSNGNYSTERRPIIDSTEMMSLRKRSEMIGFIYGTYVRCQKLKYYEDPYVSGILKKREENKAKRNRKQ